MEKWVTKPALKHMIFFKTFLIDNKGLLMACIFKILEFSEELFQAKD